jgi:hypothetical protein
MRNPAASLGVARHEPKSIARSGSVFDTGADTNS